MTTPLVNTNVNSAQFRINIDNAYQGAFAAGDPIAAVYNMQTFGGSIHVQAQHAIPGAVANNLENQRFFDSLRTNTIDAPGGAYVFKINDAQNGLFLPNSTSLNGTPPAVIGQQNGVFAAVHNGNSVEHGEYNTYVNKQVENIRTEYNNGLISANTPAARQQLALKAAAQLTDLQNTLIAGSFSNTASGVKYFLNNNDPILQQRYAAQGYGSMSNDQKRIFLQNNVYNQNINSNGDVLNRRMKDGSVQTLFTSEEAAQSYINNPNAGSVNGLTHDQWVAQHNDSVNQFKQQGFSDADAQAKATTKTNDRIVAASDLRQAGNGLPGGEGVLLNTPNTPDGVDRRRSAIEFVADMHSSGLLKAGGKALTILEIGVVAASAGKAYAEGNTTEADRIVKNYGAGVAADVITDGTFTALATAGATAVAGILGVTLSVPALVVIGLVGGIAGSLLIGDEVKDAINTLIGNDTESSNSEGASSGGISVSASEVINRSRMALAEGAIPTVITTPQNPTVLDNKVDSVDLNPNRPKPGDSTKTEATGAAGTGWNSDASQQYINQGGISNTAMGNIVTGGTRPGNGSEGQTTDIMNSLRTQAAAFVDATKPQVGGSLIATTAPFGSTTTIVQHDIVRSYDQNGVIYKSEPFSAEVSFDSQGNMVGLKPINDTNIVIKNTAGDIIFSTSLIKGTQYIPDQQSGGIGGWSAGGLRADYSHGIIRIINAAESLPYVDPLVLDASNDGVQFSQANVSFDYDADGSPEKVTWASSSDPILVLDKNSDGEINNGTELVALTNTGKTLNLFNLDENSDGKLNSKDQAYYKLKLWADINRDGYATQGELTTLNDFGIESIDLTSSNIQTQIRDIFGQATTIKGVTATFKNGQFRVLWDVPFESVNISVSTLSTTPFAQNINKVVSDGQVLLQAISNQGVFINLNNLGLANITNAVGANGNDTLIGTANDDWLIGGVGADRFEGGLGNDLIVIDADDKQNEINGGDGIDTILVGDNRGITLNLAKAKVEVVYGGYGDDVIIGGGSDNYFVDGAAGDDLIVGGNADDVLNGADGNDVLQGEKGDDLMRGGRGNDKLFGGDGNDVLDGGLGNDTINGEAGNDIVVGSGGTNIVDGGLGKDLIELHGELEDYTFIKNIDNTYTIIDHKNLDGSYVDNTINQVSDRDGVHIIKNIERFSFMRGKSPIAGNLGQESPLPVNDVIKITSIIEDSFEISISSLIANDLDFQSQSNSLSVYWVGGAIGGAVRLSDDKLKVIFTPNQGFTGTFEFSYKVKDPQNNTAPAVTDSMNPANSGELKGRVLLLPENAPNDPNYVRQWYLGASNIPNVWNMGYTGKGTKVLVLDPSGPFAESRQVANLNDPDLIANKSQDFIDSQYHATHATAVAGVIGAAKNEIGGIGVAYNATLDANSVDGGSSERISLNNMRNYDVVNNSWHADNPWNYDFYKSGSAVQNSRYRVAVENTAESGRNGLGTIMVFGAGNDRSKGYDAGLSSLTANPFSITVGAINRLGDIGDGAGLNEIFSNRGANILVAAPGSNIWTTGVQVTTADGHTIGQTSIETQGTSFAAPIVSGVVALMLEANPLLTYRDVQEILATTARKGISGISITDTVWSKNKDLNWNGIGRNFSHDLGFGVIDAAAAVRMAETWHSTYEKMSSTFSSAASTALLDNATKTLNFKINDDLRIEHVMLHLELKHERWTDLVVTLVSPSGTRSVVLDRVGFRDGKLYLDNPANETKFDQDLMSVHFRGENSVGNWQLIIQDKAYGKAGTSEINASLEVLGSDESILKRYFLTDDYVGGWALNPTQNIASELNASALSKNTRIDLSGATSSTVNSTVFNVSAGIDTLVSGGGNDTLIGGNSNETIFGAQGNDSINGGTGHDKLVGGAGNDSLYGDSGQDLLMSGNGSDSLWGGVDADVFLVDPVGNNSITTIKDFSLSQNDTLIIRANTLSFQDITQSVSGSNLTLIFSTSEGTSSIVLEGVTSQLNDAYIKVIPENEEVSINRETGAYLGKTVTYISPIIKIQEILPVAVESFYDESSVYKFENIVLPPSGYTLVNVTEGFAEAKPGQRIVIQSLGHGYIILPEDILQANWQGVTPSGNINYLIQTRYSNNGQTRYTFEQKGNTVGNDSSEEIRIGGVAKSTDTSEALWRTFASSLQSYQINHEFGLMGYGGNDKLYGDILGQRIYGGSGSDTLYGEGGNDSLWGGSDADVFVFSNGHGSDSVEDLNEIDTLSFSGISQANVSYTASFSSKSIDSFDVSMSMYTGGGNTIFMPRTYTLSDLDRAEIVLYNAQYNGGARQGTKLLGTTVSQQADFIWQEKLGLVVFNTLAGNDLVYALKNNHLTVDLGTGEDTMYALEGGNSINGSDGNDRIQLVVGTGIQKDSLYGGAGDDTIYAGANGSLIYGDDLQGNTTGVDYILGGDGSDTIYGGGNDIRPGTYQTSDMLFDNLEYLNGGAGDDFIYGQSGNDRIIGGLGNDFIDGGSDNDFIAAGLGTDTVYGGEGADNINAGAGNDYIYGGNGNDFLFGSEGNDYILGDDGNDYLDGGDGDDTLIGGVGNDYIETGSGVDVIRFSSNQGTDTVSGTSGVDTLEFTDTTNVSFQLIVETGEVKLSWGSNSVYLAKYSADTKIKFSDGTASSLRTLFGLNGYSLDTTFEFLGSYDTQLVGDLTQIRIVQGDDEAEQIYGGPLIATDPAYAYVLGRGGNDALAVGVSGGIIDGGYGNDAILASNGTLIVRDSYRGGKDRIVLPEGVTLNNLIFTRVKNPLEFYELDEISNIDQYKPTGFERFLAGSDNLLLKGVYHATTGSHVLDPASFIKYDKDPNTLYNTFGVLTDHFDTLRIQTKDGKYTTDIVGYFDEGQLKNDIDYLSFTTMFDDDGNPLNFNLDDLIAAKLKATTLKLNSRAGNTSLPALSYGTEAYWDNEYTHPLYALNNKSNTFTAKFDNEIGNTITGTFAYQVIGSSKKAYFHHNFNQTPYFSADGSPYYWSSSPSNFHNETSVIPVEITATQYQALAGSSTDWVQNFYNSIQYRKHAMYTSIPTSVPGWGGSQLGEAFVQIGSFVDVLYGFGGNDRLWGGGVFYEEYLLGKSYSATSYSFRYGFDGANLRYADRLNGGDGNDTYVYKKGDGSLVITAIDIPNLGAEGVDTLEMLDFRMSDVSFINKNRINGSFTIVIGAGTTPRPFRISVEKGINNHLQVDFIKFQSNEILSVREMLQSTSDSISEIPDDYILPERDMAKYMNVLSGSQASDVIKISDQTFVNGYEGADRYLLSDNISFSVIQMDKRDIAYVPLDFYDQELSITYGELMPLGDGKSMYSLSDWKSLSNTHESIRDALVTWTSTNALNQIVHHHVVLLDVSDGWSRRTNFGYVDTYSSEDESYFFEDGNYFSPPTQSFDAYDFSSMGNDVVTTDGEFYGLAGDDILTAVAQAIFHGGTGNDSLTGSAANDYLDGGLGRDTLKGGLGDDTYQIDSEDLLIELENAGIDEVQSFDAIDLRDLRFNNIENAKLLGSVEGVELIGDEQNNRLEGNGLGSILKGLSGNDTYAITNENDRIIENASDGYDTAEAFINLYRLDENVEAVVSAGNNLYLTGNRQNNYIVGDDGNNHLDGGGGNDTLNGGAGDDQYYVDSELDVIDENDEVDSGGFDTVWVKSRYQLAANTDIEVMKALSNIGVEMTANALNNLLVGGSGDDYLNGGAGQDSIYGDWGNDHLIGNSGNDLLSGGFGNDVLDGSIGTDTLVGGEGNDTYIINTSSLIEEGLDQGNDTVVTTLTYTLSSDSNIENITLSGNSAIDATGNTASNRLTGNAANNILDAKSGNDTLAGGDGVDRLIGGLGDDTYIVDTLTDTITELENGGIDTVQSSITFSLSGHLYLENITLSGTNEIDATGNALNNVLTGNGAKNVLNGGAGSDTLRGGNGDDVYIVDSSFDLIQEFEDEGVDKVESSATYALSEHVENLILTSSANINGNGNNLDNMITGNAGSNILNGILGNDTLIGEAGNDTYIVAQLEYNGHDNYQAGIDLIIDNDNAIGNLDAVEVGFQNILSQEAYDGLGGAYTLYLDVKRQLTNDGHDNLQLTARSVYITDSPYSTGEEFGGFLIQDQFKSSSKIEQIKFVTGEVDTLDNYLSRIGYSFYGSDNNDIMKSDNAIGAQEFHAGIGDDYLLGNSSIDRFNGNQGNDILQGMSGGDYLNGYENNDLLDGGLGVDRLFSHVGNDIVIGGKDADIISVGTGYDVILFNKGDGADTVNASVGTDNTLSLGGNFAYSDLSLSKSASDLILKMGSSDQITFKGWYSGTVNNKSIANLQIVLDDSKISSTTTVRNDKVEIFNFADVVAAFDKAGSTNNWQLSDALLSEHIKSGSNSNAIGGDIAYRYGRFGNLTGMGLSATQAVLSNSNFGQTAQSFSTSITGSSEINKLS